MFNSAYPHWPGWVRVQWVTGCSEMVPCPRTSSKRRLEQLLWSRPTRQQQNTILFSTISPNVDRFSKKITGGLSNKHVMKWSLNIPTLFKRVATLSCEKLMSENYIATIWKQTSSLTIRLTCSQQYLTNLWCHSEYSKCSPLTEHKHKHKIGLIKQWQTALQQR